LDKQKADDGYIQSAKVKMIFILPVDHKDAYNDRGEDEKEDSDCMVRRGAG
jgi:hypothetical protein